MEGQNVSAAPAQGWYSYLPSLSNKPANSSDTANVSKVPSEPSLTAAGSSCDPVFQEGKDVKQRKVVSVQNPEPVAQFAANFTELLEDAIWNKYTPEHEHQPKPRLPSPATAGNIALGSLPAGEGENSSPTPLLQSYNIVDLKESDEQVYKLLKDHMANISKTLQTEWCLLSEESQQSALTEIRALDQLLKTFSSENLATVLEKESSRLKTAPRIEYLQSLLEEIYNNYRSLAALLQPTEPVIKNIKNLCNALRLRIQLLKLNQLEGPHKASDSSWAVCNRITCADPGKINPKGLSAQFDKDILRNSNFAIFNSEGHLQFHSAVKNHECQEEDTENKSERFKNECQKQLIEFCAPPRNKMLAVVSDLISQSPYNPLYHTINQLLTEQLEPGYVVAPQERKTETRLLPQTDGTLVVELILSFSSYKLTDPDLRQYRVNQPVLIKSSITLVPDRLEERKLDDIDLQLFTATSCTNME